MRKLSVAAGFSLVEVTLALGIAAFCLIAAFGLMPVGVQTNRNATSQTAATNIIAAVVADLRATPKNNPTSSQFYITFGTNRCVGVGCSPPLYFDSQGEASCDLGGSLMSNCSSSWSPPLQTRYQLNITWTGSAGLRYADVKVTWPPTVVQTSPTPVPSGSVEVFGAFDRN